MLGLWIAGLWSLYDRHCPLLLELNDFVFDCYSKEDDQSDELQSSKKEEIIIQMVLEVVSLILLTTARSPSMTSQRTKLKQKSTKQAAQWLGKKEQPHDKTLHAFWSFFVSKLQSWNRRQEENTA